MKKLESIYKDNVRKMRSTLEKRLEKSAKSLEDQRREKQRKIARQSESSCERRRRAQKLKNDLEDGLQLWSQQVQEVQEHNMRRAEEQVQVERSRKQERAGRE